MARTIVERRSYNRDNMTHTTGPARTFALVFGIAYLLVAITEVYLRYSGNNNLVMDGMTVLSFSLPHNIVHWALGLVFLGAGLAKEWNSKAIVRALGVVLAVVAILGWFAPELTGNLLGYEGAIPVVYNWVHTISAILALLAGFLSTVPGRNRRAARNY